MTALSEALVAAQRRAISTLEKAYVAGKIDRQTLLDKLIQAGAVDAIEQEALLGALDIIHEWGAQAPSEPKGTDNGAPAPATDAQLAFIAKLVKEKATTGPGLPLTKAQAHEVIDSLQSGSYDPAKWSVPF